MDFGPTRTTQPLTVVGPAFSKKLENHAHTPAIYFIQSNSVRIHQTLRVTPAMEAKRVLPNGKEVAVADHAWTIGEIVDLLPENATLR